MNVVVGATMEMPVALVGCRHFHFGRPRSARRGGLRPLRRVSSKSDWLGGAVGRHAGGPVRVSIRSIAIRCILSLFRFHRSKERRYHLINSLEHIICLIGYLFWF